MTSCSQPAGTELETRVQRVATIAPLAAAAIATTLGGIAIVGTRFLVGHSDPLTLVLLRYSIATTCLLPLALLSGARSLALKDIPAVAGLGIVYFCVHPWALTAALKYTTAAYGSVILAGTPLLTLLFAGAVGYERITAGKFVGVMLALIGVGAALIESVLTTTAGQLTWFGNLLMFGAACAGAAYNVLSRPMLRKYPTLNVIAYGMVAGTTGLLILASFGGGAERLPAFDATSWTVLVFIGVFGAALAYYLLTWALKKTTPTRVSVFLALNPVVAILLGATILGEPITVVQIAGLICVLAGIGIANWQHGQP